ncbi:MAG: NAD(P)-binding domain-containing protein [Erysipelotrichaceae bacterium]
MAKITCVGCGMMGSNIVDAFLKKGNEVSIVDVNYSAVKPFVERGAKYFSNVKDCLDCDFIFISLPNDQIVKKAFSDVDDLNNKIVVNSCSEVPSEVIDIEQFFNRKNGRYLDCTILTYQGEVGTKYGYLLYSGNKAYFDELKEELQCLSDPAVYVGTAIVASEVVDLIAITAHFGISYTPLECLCMCDKYDYDPDLYISDLAKLLDLIGEESVNDQQKCINSDLTELIEYVDNKIETERIYEKLNQDFLDKENKSLSNHYKKIINIQKSNYNY